MNLKRLLLIATTSGAMTFSLAPVSQAAAYDPATGFSTAANPNGVYTYGFETSLGGPLTLFTTAGTTVGGEKWTSPSVDFYMGVYHGDGLDNLSLHPGPSDQDTVVRLTLPTGGLLDVTGAFANNDQATTDVHILFDGVSVFDSVIDAGQQSDPFALSHTFAAGDAIDFVVGNGGNGYGFDSTKLTALVASPGGVPEPATWALMMAGVGMIGGVARRRAKGAFQTA